MTFSEKLRRAQAQTGSRLCVGLDPDPGRLPAALDGLDPAEAALAFCTAIVEATTAYACAFKPNMAFFEALGPEGWRAFETLVGRIPRDRVVIADAKRGDIGNTGRLYARAFFERLPCDAVTVAPYMGGDSVEPFLGFPGRAAFVLVATSNPGGAELQELEVDGEPLYRRVAKLAAGWAEGAPGEVGFVVGATRPEPLAALRRAHPNVPFLVPGVGTQGGDARSVIDAAGSGPLVINVGRQILYASSGTDFATAAARAAESLAREMAV